ncbi:MAG: hypothetical protein WBD81_09395 [Collimonas pratensis]|uniref:hypothetical protein n=1 Tax=Collimonas pratensis TaxID=279113 RepID=UPI003C720DAC
MTHKLFPDRNGVGRVRRSPKSRARRHLNIFFRGGTFSACNALPEKPELPLPRAKIMRLYLRFEQHFAGNWQIALERWFYRRFNIDQPK